MTDTMMKIAAPKIFQSSTRPQTTQSRLYGRWLLLVIFPFAIIFFFFNVYPNFQVKIGNIPLLSFESFNKVLENNPPVNEAPSKNETLAAKLVYFKETSLLNTSSDEDNHHRLHKDINGMQAIHNKTAPNGNLNQRNSAVGNASKDKKQANPQVDLKSPSVGSANVNGPTPSEATPMGTQGSKEVTLRNSSGHKADDGSGSQTRTVNYQNNSSQERIYTPEEKNGNIDFNGNVTSPSKDSRSSQNTTSVMGEMPAKGSAQCDISTGVWVRDPEGSLYTNNTCAHIQQEQNCPKNERMGMGYWRWKPDGCDLQRFDAVEFLKLMKGKSIAFVGDSIAINQGLSLICLLTEMETPTVVFTSKGGQSKSWQFPSSNFTMSVLWAPFLVKETENNIEGILPRNARALHLDVLEKDWVAFLPNLRVAVLSTGQWFSKPAVHMVKSQAVGCYQCSKTQQLTNETGFHKAFRAAMRSTLRGITSLPGYRGITFFHTLTAAPDRAGQICLRTTRPGGDAGSSSMLGPKTPKAEMHTIRMGELRRAQRKEAPNGSGLKLLDTRVFHGGAQQQVEGAECWEEGEEERGCVLTRVLHSAWNEIVLHSLRHPTARY